MQQVCPAVDHGVEQNRIPGVAKLIDTHSVLHENSHYSTSLLTVLKTSRFPMSAAAQNGEIPYSLRQRRLESTPPDREGLHRGEKAERRPVEDVS